MLLSRVRLPPVGVRSGGRRGVRRPHREQEQHVVLLQLVPLCTCVLTVCVSGCIAGSNKAWRCGLSLHPRAAKAMTELHHGRRPYPERCPVPTTADPTAHLPARPSAGAVCRTPHPPSPPRAWPRPGWACAPPSPAQHMRTRSRASWACALRRLCVAPPPNASGTHQLRPPLTPRTPASRLWPPQSQRSLAVPLGRSSVGRLATLNTGHRTGLRPEAASQRP